MLVVVAIISILIALSTPLSNFYKSNRVATHVQDFVSALNTARNHAVAGASPASVCISDGATPPNCVPVANAAAVNEWGTPTGWLVFTDANGNCLIDAGETLINQNTMSTGFSLQVATHNCINYTAAGITPVTNGTWTLCDPSRDANFKRGINLNVAGRVQILGPTNAGLRNDVC